MNLHVVLAQNAHSDLDERVKSAFGDDAKQIAPNQWVVAADMTDQGISDKLQVSEGQLGRIMVATMTTYYGWHERDLWGWLSIKEGK